MRLIICFSLMLSASACINKKTEKPGSSAANALLTAQKEANIAPTNPEFAKYWFQGKAELSTYEVEQERYGEIRNATQVNVFVTEDFSRSKQVKLDDAAAAGADRLPVLKLNSLRRFETGIYDYAIMQSVFTPIDGSPTVKSTCSVQDWCGQVFFQTNLAKEGYRARGFSYFEAEGDSDVKLPAVQLEDALWTQIRINPEKIKTGKQQIIPACLYSRIRHKAYTALDATVNIEKGGTESVLSVLYEGTPRSLKIRFEHAFPYRILGWEEMDNARLSSRGTLKKQRMEAYWGQNSNAFSPLRDSLGLR